MLTRYLDHDRTPIGIVVLHAGTFFGRDIHIEDKLAERIERVLDNAAAIRGILQRVYEQPDGRIRSAVLETVKEDLIRLCDEVENGGKLKPKASEAISSGRSRSQQKRLESQLDTSQKTE